MLYFPELNRIYKASWSDDAREFAERSLEELDMRINLRTEHLERIPREGPVIIVANHPYGALEGVVLIKLLRSIRTDARVLANYLLERIEPLRSTMIFVDPFGRENSVAANIRAMKECVRHLKDGGALGVFPAGEVSHLNLRRRAICDPTWQDTVARLIRISRAPVLPLYFEGRNNLLFQLAGLVHPRLRTLLLPYALMSNRHRTIGVRVGSLIPFARLDAFEDDDDLLSYLRMRTYMLGTDERLSGKSRLIRSGRRQRRENPIIPSIGKSLLARDVERLPRNQLLLESAEYEVWYGHAAQVPNILREIGRLRETTFRRAGEGTGRPLDLDRFDPYYLHLFVWNRDLMELVGAYRLGRTDEILPRFGQRGMYTSTLFKLGGAFFRRIDPALELGRSFVRDEYQRQHSPLALLWKGIGSFIVAHPQYKILFGPVSINSEYQSISQQMMIAFLRAHSDEPELGRLIKPRNPPRWGVNDDVCRGTRLVADIKEVSSLVSEIEWDHKGVPILLRRYLQLNAKFLSWNVDPGFSNVLDCLMMADLTQTDPRILERHMGKAGLTSFLEYHRRKQSLSA
jgi:putative hemolysin